jgi:hypothetical protein
MLGRAPCMRVEHLTKEEQRLLRLAANRLGEKGEEGALALERPDLFGRFAGLERPGAVSRTIRRSSRPRCSNSPIAATSSSTRSWAQARR